MVCFHNIVLVTFYVLLFTTSGMPAVIHLSYALSFPSIHHTDVYRDAQSVSFEDVSHFLAAID